MTSISKQDVEAHSVSDDKTKAALVVKDGDEALRFLATEAIAGDFSRVDEKALVRKIDWMIIPLMWCCYCLQYLDKTLSMLTSSVDETQSNMN